jgi:hypothetical protein
VCRVQSGVVLLQGPRRAALARARELLRRVNPNLRLPGVRGTGRSQVSPVQGVDVLQKEAQDEALVGARELVRGAVRVEVDGYVDRCRYVDGDMERRGRDEDRWEI